MEAQQQQGSASGATTPSAGLTAAVAPSAFYLGATVSDKNMLRTKDVAHLVITPELHQYVLQHSLREPEVLGRVVQATVDLSYPARMITAPDQAQFMGQLVKFGKVKRIIEVGVFTGYSSLALALALPEDGKLVALDINPTWTEVARKFWREAGVEHKVELRLGAAVETLDHLVNSAEENARDSFDLAFIDADKVNYYAYYERLLQLVRVGGLIVVDNVLRSGGVIDPDNTNPDTQAIKEFNAKLYNDDRVEVSMLGLGDGVTVALRVK
eukprot:TRINITY_DN2321_c0_g1_i4.p1 TRINITY_DN2321_c0_g1~~TRINITY_DN2321_c0_g1_i4.p1  ORF type:complete len:283 (+),score=87.73 TRINITY_DN2321_c0_g1_i4:43-849(+)